MIPHIRRGSNVRGLVAYLWGPGDKDEHSNHRTVASSKGQLVDFDTAYVTDTARADALSKWADTLERLPAKHVWHCSIRVAPDESLTDAQWAEVAQSALSAAGISDGPSDPNGCHWVAMSHDGDAGNHIHIAAVLIRPDGSTAKVRRDYVAVGEVCREFEAKWQLTRTASRDGNAHPARTKRDYHQVANAGIPTLDRRAVRAIALEAAAQATDWDEYSSKLEAAGLTVRPRMSTIVDGQVTGYAVEIPATGERVAGGKLGRGLSYNRLTEAWTQLEHGTGAAEELRQLRTTRSGGQEALIRALQRAAMFPDPDSADALGTVLQVGANQSDDMRAAAEHWERARYYAGRQARTQTGRTIRAALRQMERGNYEAALVAAALELAVALARVMATNVAMLSQKSAADCAAAALRVEHDRRTATAAARSLDPVEAYALRHQGAPTRASKPDEGRSRT